MDLRTISGRRIALTGLGLGVGALLLAGCNLGTPAVGYTLTDSQGDVVDPNGIATGDIDGDGDVDLVATGRFDATVMLNDGSGTFTAGPPIFGGGGQPSLADVDDDDDLDLLITVPSFEFGDQAVPALRRNDGTGAFGDYEVLETTEPLGGLTSLVPADADGDGDVDLLSTLRSTLDGDRQIGTYLNDGTGDFGPPSTSSLAFSTDTGSPVLLVTGDLDGDGDVDVVAADDARIDEGEITVERTFALVGLNDGTGAFTARPPIDTGTSGIIFATTPALGDLDGDGDLDLALGGGGGVSVLDGDGTGGFGAPQRTRVDGAREVDLLRPADIDGDGHLDLVGFGDTFGPTQGVVIYGDGIGGVDQVLKVGTGAKGLVARDLDVVDIDGDADLDVLYAAADGLGVLENVNGGR
jgi:hypothetical protein